MELFLVTLVVEDYDDAIAYFCGKLGFRLVEDTKLEDGKRWIVVSPDPSKTAGARILLAKATTPPQREAIGDQAGGRVGFFLRTADFEATYKRYKEHGVVFCEAPRDEAYGKVVVFKDLYGNKWDLIGAK